MAEGASGLDAKSIIRYNTAVMRRKSYLSTVTLANLAGELQAETYPISASSHGMAASKAVREALSKVPRFRAVRIQVILELHSKATHAN